MSWFLWNLGARIDALQRCVDILYGRIDRMVTGEEFDAALLAAATATNDLARRVDADLKAKDAALQDLRDQLAAGVVITDAHLAAVQALKVNLDAIDPAASSA